MTAKSISEKDLFLAALEKASAGERSAFLDEACGPDSSLRDRVEALLRSHEQPDSVLDKPAINSVDSASSPPLTPSASIPVTSKNRIEWGRRRPMVLTETHPHRLRKQRCSRSLSRHANRRTGTSGPLRGPRGRRPRRHGDRASELAIASCSASSRSRCWPPSWRPAAPRERFIREAQAAAAVRDDHVVNIYAVQEDGSLPYLVMEYIAGTTLEERIKRGAAGGEGGVAYRHAGGTGPGGRTCAGTDPSRRQAGEHPAGERRRARQDHRLWPGPRGGRRQPDAERG